MASRRLTTQQHTAAPSACVLAGDAVSIHTGHSLALALAALADGKAIGVPTDTVYGIAARDPSLLAIIKGRGDDKPVAVLVASLEQAEALAVFTEEDRVLCRKHWPGPLTLVLRRRPGVSLGDDVTETIGVRMPNHPTALQLLEAAGPLPVSSANRSEELAALNELEAKEIFGSQIAVYLAGSSTLGQSSTVIDRSREERRVLRPGPLEDDGDAAGKPGLAD